MPTAHRLPVLLALFFASGFAALVYQVLWVRELGLLFGSTAQAAALTIAIFFAGIASGGWWWGRRSPRISSGLRWFGILEIGVAVTALSHFLLVDAYHALYPTLYAAVGHAPALDTAAKAAIAAVVLLPPAFLMGGTLPLLGHHVVRAGHELSRRGTLLYAVNTAGSATGALAAGFVLPLALGFTGAYLLAVGLDAAVGLTAVALAAAERAAARARATDVSAEPQRAAQPADVPSAAPERPARALRLAGVPGWAVGLAAFASGFAALGVEVVWTRLFGQVLQNSAYTYALVLTTFLLALALGAGGAGALARLRGVDVERILAGLLLASGAVIAASPWLFHTVTDGLAYLGGDQGWGGYVAAVAGVAFVVMLLPGVVIGAVLPYLLRVLESSGHAPGEALGRLVAANTVGAILGSLAAGFALLPAFGSSRSLLLLAAVYPLLVAATALSRPTVRRAMAAAAATAAAVGLAVAAPSGLEAVSLGDDERLVDFHEGSHANVAVVGSDGQRSIRVNNHYTLGGSRALHGEQNQTVVPLLAHRDPARVFYLGMGTGITAGASLSFPVEDVTVCELVPGVVDAAEAHFGLWTDGLFADERVAVHAEDGRTCLRRSPDRYDVIVSDLFTPWKAGTGNLYTLEHYETARQRLEPGGRFVQWVPLYQVSERELAIIARTMDEAFEEVVAWRGDHYPSRSILALVGQAADDRLDAGALAERAAELGRDDLHPAAREALGLRMYAGNVTAAGLFDDAPVNTDARPLIEYLAPRTHRAVRAGEASFLVGAERDDLLARLAEAAPPADDPHLADLDERQRGYVAAGLARTRAAGHAERGEDADAERLRAEAAELLPGEDLRTPAEELLRQPGTALRPR